MNVIADCSLPRQTSSIVRQYWLAALLFGIPSGALLAQSPACTAIDSKDVAPIVGTATMKANGTGCSWRADANHFVVVLDNTPKSKAMPVEAMFGAAKNAASQSGTVTDEKGLGDRAFLSIASSGLAVLQMMKGDHLLQVQLSDGTAHPSAANLALMRAIAAKAIAKT